MTGSILVALVVLGAVGVLLYAVGSLLSLGRDRRAGALVGVDLERAPGRRLASPRLRLVGRPDELRRQRDGRLVPVEFKSRPSPRGGPLRSHRLQVAAYCLLLEEETGESPPFGLLRYGDGGEWEIPWDDDQRAEVLRLLADLRRPYDGSAHPSLRRCARCGWRAACDAKAV